MLATSVAFYRFLWPVVVDRAIGLELPLRVLISVAVIVPVGLALGAFMPIGLTRVARVSALSGEYVAWAWAVNGFFSVISSVLSTILAMIVGFNAILLMGLCCYVVAVAAMSRIRTT